MADQTKAATAHVEDFENNPRELDDISTREPGIVDVSVLKPERENDSIIDNTRTTEEQVSSRGLLLLDADICCPKIPSLSLSPIE